MTTDRDLIERVAQAMAEETNGGDFRDGRWYAEEHRQLWRRRAQIAIDVVETWKAPPGGWT